MSIKRCARLQPISVNELSSRFPLASTPGCELSGFSPCRMIMTTLGGVAGLAVGDIELAAAVGRPPDVGPLVPQLARNIDVASATMMPIARSATLKSAPARTPLHARTSRPPRSNGTTRCLIVPLTAQTTCACDLHSHRARDGSEAL